MKLTEAKEWHFDIDKYINPYLPRNHISRLPKPIAHFLGHRDKPRKEIGNVLVAGWACLGAFAGCVVIEAAFKIPAIYDHHTPLIVASFGAVAILEYNAIESPLAQPRNSILGHFLAALVGICITKLFALSPSFDSLRWLAGALSCGLASAIMTVTKTTYPPAGATALLAAVDPQVEQLGWYLLPLVMLSCMLTLAVSLLVNNVQRQYPIYWWTPAELGKEQQKEDDIEKAPKSMAASGQSSLSDHDPAQPPYATNEHADQGPTITITPHRVVIPEHIFLAQEETGILEILRDRLGEGLPAAPNPAVINKSKR